MKQPTPSKLDTLISSSLHLRDRTKELYRGYVAEFVAFAGDDPHTYTSEVVENFLSSLLSRLQPQTVNVYRKAIRFASKRWAKHKTATEPRVNFAADVDKVNMVKEPEKREALTYEEAAKLIATCDGDELAGVRDRAIIVLALRSGLRRGGLCALELAGIRPPKITTINKGGKRITFEADAETFDVLKAWIDPLRASGVSDGRVFRTVKGDTIGEPMTPFQVWRVFNVRAKRAKIRHVFPHLMRHSTVTWLREAGKSSAEVSKLTGQSERTIEDTYTHVRLTGAVGDALPSLLGKQKQEL